MKKSKKTATKVIKPGSKGTVKSHRKNTSGDTRHATRQRGTHRQ
ncbi:hypothetical protein [Longitalea arenae]|nr:hypothetical protein [Longitalea arenae]